MADYMLRSDYWAAFYYAYSDWERLDEYGWHAGSIPSEAEKQLFRILRTVREHGRPMRHIDNVDTQFILCEAWHEMQREKCIQERWA